MKITRIIHPIGQGGFYSETLKEGGQEITVVYDCGGNSKPFMENYLENYFPKIDEKPTKKKNDKKESKKTIDAVFISHMHEDHVNGLDYLLNQFHVRYLILPRLSEDEKLEAFIYNYLKNPESIGNELIRDLYTRDSYYYLNSRTRVITVPYNDNLTDEGNELLQIEFNNQHDLDLTIDEENTKISFLSPGSKVHFREKWVYIPFNPPIKRKQDVSFYDFLKDRLSLRDFTIKDLPDIIEKQGVKRCKKVYTDYFGEDHNSYSMTVFSGVLRDDEMMSFIKCSGRKLNQKRRYPPRCPHYDNWACLNPNCLYMGDFETKDYMKLLQRFYRPLWDKIGQVQVPHHGSGYNHKDDLYEFAELGFISVGEENSYHHPNIDTLMGIKEMACRPILVTENMSTIKVFHATDER